MSAAEALRKARELILEDCAALVACHTHPVSGELDDEAAVAARARYHEALSLIDAALDAGQAQPLTEERIVMEGLMMLPTADAHDCAKTFKAGVRFAERAHGVGAQP